jgi:hypothetical protein
MKAVVSSLVALAIAIAPAYAMAAPEKPAHPQKHAVSKVAKKKSVEKDKEPIVVTVRHTVKTGKKHGDVAPHKGEPKASDATIVPASMMQKAPKLRNASAMSKEEMPKLPAPSAQKAAKEKGGKKHHEKKEKASDSKDGQPERDEELADLVARIRGLKSDPPAPKKTCLKDAVEVIRGAEMERFELATCDGHLAPLAVERLSVLVRPGNTMRPATPMDELAKKKGFDLAPGIRRIDSRLVERLDAIASHFAKKGHDPKISIVSGYRPQSVGSQHQIGRAMDFHLDGVKNEDVVAFCKTLDDTGCGYYPNSSFVHVDVREPGTGHVSWIDASGPGETPRYVQAWPEPKKTNDVEDSAKPALESTSMKTEEKPAAGDEPLEPLN